MRSRGFHTALLTALVPLAAFGAQAAEQAPAVTVQGMAFEVAIFEEDAVAFGNRDYLWKEVPEQFAGWQFTQTWGGRQSRIEVTPASDGPVYVATAPTQKGVDMAGWESLDGVKFHYTSAGYTALHVYSKQGKAGETISIPQGNWTGVIVLAPEMRAGVIEEFKITPPPGVVIDTSPDFGRIYIGSPSITILPNGSYVASHDWFGPGTPMRQTTVLGSKDRGKTWTRLADLDGQWWSTLFVHEDDLYIIGTTARYGNVAIRRSTDGGLTWTTPDDASAGLLLDDGKYHCAPMPVVVHKGRIWRTMEDSRGGGGWGPHFRAFVMSVPVDADLLNAANWTFSNRLKFDPAWYPGERPGWLEGNVVVPPEGGLVNILRFNDDEGDIATILDISDDGKTISIDPETAFIDFPGGRTKFTLRFDPKTKRYWTLANKQRNPKAFRNILVLTSSADLRNWQVEATILKHPDEGHHAFQYVDWVFDGDDIIAASRTGWDGSHNAHDANFMTFHRIADFRALAAQEPPPDISGTSEH